MALFTAEMLADPAYKAMVDAHFRVILEGVQKMTQKLYTIEVKVDFKDPEKFPLFQKIVTQAARQVFSQGALLNDGVKPEVVVYGHDYFKGHADLPLFDDDIESGKKAITEAGNPPAEAVLTTGAAAVVEKPAEKPANPQGFSQALLDAMK